MPSTWRQPDNQLHVPQRQQCPKCNGINVARASLTVLAVYIRCNDCGELWSFRDRRLTRRMGDPKPF